VPVTVPAPNIVTRNPYAPTPRSKCSWTSSGINTCCGASWSMRITAKSVIVTQSHGMFET
jgi:hypothetical protein